MATQKPRRAANFAQAAVYTLVFLAILGAINFLGNRYNETYDATANKFYTLSDQTKRIADELDQPLTISYWDRPVNFPIAEELLTRYAALSSNINVVYEDIDKDALRAREEGVTAPGQMFVQVGNRREEAGGLTEQEITGAMVRAIQGGDRMVCFATGYGEADTTSAEPGGYSSALGITESNNYKTQVVPLLPTPVIPADCTILILAGPQRNYLQPAVDEIKTYVETGGRVLVMLDPPLQFGATPTDENPDLVALLGSWGVTVNKDMVFDLSGVGRLFGMNEQLVVVTKYPRHPIVAQMGNLSVGIPITRSLVATGGPDTEVESILESGQDSVVANDLSSAEIEVDPKTAGPQVLAVAGTYNTGPQTPTEDAKQDEPLITDNGHFVVMGSSRWASNNFLRFNGNSDLYLNMLNWLSSDENLIAIRPKDPEDRRLNMNASQISLLFYGSVVFLPLLMAIAGFSVWWRRR